MRLFVGIPLAPAVVSELEALVARLKPGLKPEVIDGLRWMPPRSWHITVQYLGNTDAEHYECLVARLGELHASPVPIHLDELSIFERAGVFIAGVAAVPELARLAEQVTAATSLCGFVAETRPFHPHITLARAKGHGHGNPLRALAKHAHPGFSRFVAEEFLLYESHTEPEGARYEVRARFPLVRRPEANGSTQPSN